MIIYNWNFFSIISLTFYIPRKKNKTHRISCASILWVPFIFICQSNCHICDSKSDEGNPQYSCLDEKYYTYRNPYKSKYKKDPIIRFSHPSFLSLFPCPENEHTCDDDENTCSPYRYQEPFIHDSTSVRILLPLSWFSGYHCLIDSSQILQYCEYLLSFQNNHRMLR